MASSGIVILSSLAISICILQPGNSQNIPIYLAGFFSFNTEPDTSGILPAVEMALDHINNNSDVLSGYELKMEWKDIKVTLNILIRNFLSRNVGILSFRVLYT